MLISLHPFFRNFLLISALREEWCGVFRKCASLSIEPGRTKKNCHQFQPYCLKIQKKRYVRVIFWRPKAQRRHFLIIIYKFFIILKILLVNLNLQVYKIAQSMQWPLMCCRFINSFGQKSFPLVLTPLSLVVLKSSSSILLVFRGIQPGQPYLCIFNIYYGKEKMRRIRRKIWTTGPHIRGNVLKFCVRFPRTLFLVVLVASKFSLLTNNK